MEQFERVPVESYQSPDLVIEVIFCDGSTLDVLRLPGIPAGRTVCNGCSEKDIRPVEEDPLIGTAGDAGRDQSQASVGPLDWPASGGHRKSSPTPVHDCEDDARDERTRASLTWRVAMDPMLASCLVAELQRSRSYETVWRRSLLGTSYPMIAKRTRRHPQRDACTNHSIPTMTRDEPQITIRIHMKDASQLFKMEPDIRWSERMLPLWTQRVQMEEVFSWLSTLGGAYSSLGDNMYNCAVEAGRVAIRQLYLAERLGDALLRARCLLYVALSLMQRGHLAKAKRIVRRQYKFATSSSGHQDTRLISMCLGIWHHLRHRYSKRREI